MKKVIDISEETYRDLEAEAGRQGQTPSAYAEALLKEKLGNAGVTPESADLLPCVRPFGVPQVQVSDREALTAFFESNARRLKGRISRPLPSFSGGGLLVDVSNRNELYNAMDDL